LFLTKVGRKIGTKLLEQSEQLFPPDDSASELHFSQPLLSCKIQPPSGILLTRVRNARHMKPIPHNTLRVRQTAECPFTGGWAPLDPQS
jgi:hypothetical protein